MPEINNNTNEIQVEIFMVRYDVFTEFICYLRAVIFQGLYRFCADVFATTCWRFCFGAEKFLRRRFVGDTYWSIDILAQTFWHRYNLVLRHFGGRSFSAGRFGANFSNT